MAVNQTREHILETARILFNQHGYDRVTMRMIAGELSISPGNLTYHFRHKADIVTALMDQSFDETYLPIPIRSVDDLLAQFRRMLETIRKNAFYFLDDEALLHPDDHSGVIHVHLVEGLRYLTDTGIFDRSFTPEKQHAVLVMLLMSHQTWLRQTERGGNAMPIDEFIGLHRTVLSAYLAK